VAASQEVPVQQVQVPPSRGHPSAALLGSATATWGGAHHAARDENSWRNYEVPQSLRPGPGTPGNQPIGDGFGRAARGRARRRWVSCAKIDEQSYEEAQAKAAFRGASTCSKSCGRKFRVDGPGRRTRCGGCPRLQYYDLDKMLRLIQRGPQVSKGERGRSPRVTHPGLLFADIRHIRRTQRAVAAATERNTANFLENVTNCYNFNARPCDELRLRKSDWRSRKNTAAPVRANSCGWSSRATTRSYRGTENSLWCAAQNGQ